MNSVPQSNQQPLTNNSILKIMIMCAEPALLSELFVHREDSSLFSRVSVDPISGKVVLGKTRLHWWNWLINDTRTFSLVEFVAHARTMLANRAPEEDRYKLFNALQAETDDQLLRLGKSNEVIDRLFMLGYMGVKTSWSNIALGVQGVLGKNDQQEVTLNVRHEDQEKRFVLPGSGDSIVDVIVGVKGVRYSG